jgi:hypothetical protein
MIYSGKTVCFNMEPMALRIVLCEFLHVRITK